MELPGIVVNPILHLLDVSLRIISYDRSFWHPAPDKLVSVLITTALRSTECMTVIDL